MEKIGIICEYNPFHNGHLYHIKKIKSLYPDSLIVLVMSTYFTQRGDVSLISKYNKTRIALSYGVDLVIEMPTLYSTNSADYFAKSAIEALNYANVDRIIFGSESDDINLLEKIVDAQNSGIDSKIKEELKKGENYPTALSKALGTTLQSNDILGISYIKSIQKINPFIKYETIKRTNSFNDIDSDEEIVSAQNIREKLKNDLPISKYIPSYDENYINNVDLSKLFYLLRYKILTDAHLNAYLGVDEGLENKLKKEVHRAYDFETLLERVKSKRYTTSRLKRMFIHILLGIEKKDMLIPNETYRILGFSSKCRLYLKELNSKHLVYKSTGRIREIEIISSLIYYELTHDESYKEEFLNRPIKKQ